MRKNTLFTILFFSLISCQNEVEFNNSAIQALKNNVIWKASLIAATRYPDGSLVIKANQKNEVLVFNTTSTTPQTYTLGSNNFNKIKYEQKINGTVTIFSTGINSEEGQIVITEYDNVNKTVSGTFQFYATNNSPHPVTDTIVNFQQGVFYKVPVAISL